MLRGSKKKHFGVMNCCMPFQSNRGRWIVGIVGVLLVIVGLSQSLPAEAQAHTPSLATRGQGILDDSAAVAGIPEAAKATLQMLNVKDADLRDVFRSIAHEYGLNVMIDNRIDRHVTVRLANVPLVEALTFLCRQNDLRLRRIGQIFYVEQAPTPPSPPPEPPSVIVHDSLLTVDLREDDLAQVVRLLAAQSGMNIMIRRGVRGTLSGTLQDVPIDQGLRTLVLSNGFSIRSKEGIYHIDRSGTDETAKGVDTSRTFWVQLEDTLLSLDVAGARIADVLREVVAQAEVNLITYDVPEGSITAKADSLTLDEGLNLLLKQTSITYRRNGDIYYIGDRNKQGIATTRLIRLDHIRADAVLEMIPALIADNASIQVVKEHNGLMITGTNDVIVELEHFVREVDYPTPQILIEALVVDFQTNDLFELGLAFGRNAETAATEAATGYQFNGSVDIGSESGLHVSGDGRQTNDVINALTRPFADLFGIDRIARLPDDFYVRLHALSVEGKVNVRSRPQVATLNGHTASLRIGTTQYYILRTQTPYQNPNQVVLQQSQRFEKIEANVVLEITPWVSASGEVTVDIRPEFSMPVGEFNPDIPPTINSRVLESTVRLHDGETIILGGLIQDEEHVVRHKVPLLGSIPLLGRLFRSTAREQSKSELVIFLTPHVFYGDERDGARWESLQEKLDLQGLKKRNAVEKVLDLQ